MFHSYAMASLYFSWTQAEKEEFNLRSYDVKNGGSQGEINALGMWLEAHTDEFYSGWGWDLGDWVFLFPETESPGQFYFG